MFLMTHDIFETFSDSIVIFLGERGGSGVLRLRDDGAWNFYNPGSQEWDYFHQLVYRNFKAQALAPEELARRGIVLPDLDAYVRQAVFVEWPKNFDGDISFDRVNTAVLGALLVKNSPIAIFLVLSEDLYESAFGDGVARDAEAAFWDETAARAFIDRKNAENAARAKDQMGYAYSLKTISLSVDVAQKKIRAQLNIEKYEHYTLARTLELLGCAPAQQ